MKLYKYYPLSKYSPNIFTKHELFFFPFSGLNDPFEIAVKYTFGCDQQKKHDYFLENIPEYKQFSPEGQRDYIKSFEERYSKSNHSLLQMLRRSFGESGVTCFSESHTDILMWGHYASRHRGFCVEFDTELDPIFEDAFKVAYFDKFQEVLYYDGMTVKDAISKKFDAWKYEKEWRIAKPKSGPQVVSPKCITRVFCGALNRFMPTEENDPWKDRDVYFDVIKVASTHLPHVKFKSFQFSKEEYKLIEF